MSDTPLAADVLHLLTQSSDFKGLPPAAIHHLLGEGKTEHLEAGSTVFVRGDHGDKLYVVLSGLVSVSIVTHPRIRGDESECGSTAAAPFILNLIRPGELFGEVACLLDQGHRTATVTVARDCTLAVVSRERLFDTLTRFPEFSASLHRRLAGYVKSYSDHLAGLVSPVDRKRVEEAKQTRWQRLAKGCIRQCAKPWVSILHVVLFAGWMLRPRFSATPWDQASKDAWTDLLTNFVSLEAIFLSILVLVAQRMKEHEDESRDEAQFTNTHVGVAQASAILRKLERVEGLLKEAASKEK